MEKQSLKYFKKYSGNASPELDNLAKSQWKSIFYIDIL